MYNTRREVIRYLKNGFHNRFKDMDAIEFEYFMSRLFSDMGYLTRVTPASGDYGADVIASKDKTKIAIQVKKYDDTVIGVKQLHEVIGAKDYYSADRAIFITTSSFSKNAKELAEKSNVELWDWDLLKKNIEDTYGKIKPDAKSRGQSTEMVKCSECGRQFKTGAGLQSHRRHLHNMNQPESNNGKVDKIKERFLSKKSDNMSHPESNNGKVDKIVKQITGKEVEDSNIDKVDKIKKRLLPKKGEGNAKVEEKAIERAHKYTIQLLLEEIRRP